MNPELPVIDDTKVWDAMLSLYNSPAIAVALELDVFEALQEPASAVSLAKTKGFSPRGVTALLALLKVLGFLDKHRDEYQLTALARTYMLKDSPYCWANFFKFTAERLPLYTMLLENLRDGNSVEKSAVQGWAAGEIDPHMAKVLTDYMHCHSMASAVGLTKTCDFSNVLKLLDIGGGSGCYAAALANHYRDMRCTVMELPTICEVANEYIKKAGVADRVDTKAVDMFRQQWPSDYDAHFFANVFHDWNFETCTDLAKLSYQSLAPGGSIYLQEMLLDESGDSPEAAVAFSFLMSITTKGQQFTFSQLENILSEAGFSDIKAQRSYGYYSLVSGKKN